MKILPQSIAYGLKPITNNGVVLQNKNLTVQNSVEPKNIQPIWFVNFYGVNQGASLKKLAKYGLPDMYTGEPLLPLEFLEDLVRSGASSLSLNQLIPILNKKEDFMEKTELSILNILKKMPKKDKNMNISQAFKSIAPEHEKLLIKFQQPVFEELIYTACDMPDKYYK